MNCMLNTQRDTQKHIMYMDVYGICVHDVQLYTHRQLDIDTHTHVYIYIL